MSVHSFFVIRSLLNLAKENKLTESFLWIPSLEGPTFDSPPTEMMSWIKEWTGRNYLFFLISGGRVTLGVRSHHIPRKSERSP